MALTIEQSSTPLSADRWSWEVWIEGPEEQLDRVESVTYQLHETFPEPVRTVRDRETKFRLRSSGWGEFIIYISVKYGDGTTESLRHWLQLDEGARSKGKGTELALKDDRPSAVFVSASLADSDVAQGLKAAFERLGVRVISTDEHAHFAEKTESTLEFSLESLLSEADFGVAVISDETTQWVRAEVEEMTGARTPVIPLLRDEETALPLGLDRGSAITLARDENLEDVARRVIKARDAMTD